jgi:hypothetical protein
MALVVLVPSTTRSDPATTIVGRMVESLGGEAAITRLHSLAVEAECSGPGGPFRTRVESLRPNSVYFKQTFADGTLEVWSTPSRTWVRHDGGTSKPAGEDTRLFIRGHEFHLLLFEIESRFTAFHEAGPSTVDGRRCELITMRDEFERPASICIDPTSARPLMLELNPPLAEGAVRIHFGDWERIGRLWYFRRFLMTEGAKRVFRYHYVEISPNRVDPKRFAAPLQDR